MKRAYDLTSQSFKIVRMIPGFITLLLLFAPIWATVIGVPELVLYYVAFLSVYWFYKTIVTNIGNLVGFRRYKRALELNWDAMIQRIDWAKLPNPEQLPASYADLKVIILIPFYKEPYEVLSETVKSILDTTYDLKKIHLVLAVEESGGEASAETARRIGEDFGDKFGDYAYYFHPKGIPGEAIGIAGPNLSWAAREYVKKLQSQGQDLKNYLTIKYDSDMLLSKKFLSNFVHTYLVTPDRYHAFFSPATILYSNNYWKVPLLVRVFSGILTLALLSEWVISKKKKQSFSCFGFSLQLLHDIDYWDPMIGVDDTGFYWRAYLTLDGNFRGEEFYSPCYMDAVEAENYVKTHVVHYKQLRRWGWGAIVYPMAIQAMATNKKMPMTSKIASLAEMFRVYNLYSTIAFLLTFAIPIVALIKPDFGLQSSAHVLPKIASTLLAISTLGLIPSRAVLEGLYGAPPKSSGFLFYLWHYVEQVMLVIFSLTLGFFPYLQAQIEMMFGKSMTFIVTPKIRKGTSNHVAEPV